MLSIRIATSFFAIIAASLVTDHARATDNFVPEKRVHGNLQKQQSYYGGDGLPSHIRNVGTYAGATFAIRAPRNGTYVTAEGTTTNPLKTSSEWGRAKIIRINAKMMDAACSYEAGVCVIRP